MQAKAYYVNDNLNLSGFAGFLNKSDFFVAVINVEYPIIHL